MFALSRQITAFCFCALVIALGPAAKAAELPVEVAARSGLSITIYNRDLGFVRDLRQVELAPGENRLVIHGVSERMEPTSVLLGLDGRDGLAVLERAFRFDTISRQSLLRESLGKRVRYVRVDPQSGEERIEEATLIDAGEPPLLAIGERIEVMGPENPGRIVFVERPEGLTLRPQLEALVESGVDGPARLALSYLTKGLTWQADYVVSLSGAGQDVDAEMAAVVTLTNTSGVDYPQARVRLVAGEVNEMEEPVAAARATMEMAAAPMADAAGAGAPEAVADRYVYQLRRPVSLADRETRQVALFDADTVTARREYRFENLQPDRRGPDMPPQQALIRLNVENESEAGLGRPLPGGTVRVYEADAEGGALFVGEDRIQHTPEGGMLRLTLGRAFDVSARAVQTDFQRISNTVYEDARRITVANEKPEPVSVVVTQRVPLNARLLSESAKHETEAAGYWVWTLEVPAEGETVLDYRIRVSN